MKKIKKYFGENDSSSLLNKVASYSAIAGALLVAGPQMSAQTCINPGDGAVGIDIDGDGTDDVTLTTSVGAPIMGGTSIAPFSTATGFNYNPVATPFILSTQTILPVGAPVTGLYSAGGGACTATIATSGRFYFIATQTATFMASSGFAYSNYTINPFYVSASAGGNNIVGLTAGTSNCAIFDSNAGPAFLNAGGTYVQSFSYAFNSYYRTDVTYTVYFDGAAAATAGSPGVYQCFNSPGAATFFAGYAAGYLGGGYQVANTGGTALANAGTTMGSIANVPGNTFLAVQFQGAADAQGGTTYNGWVEITPNADGSVCVAASGFNSCSVETAAANAADPCIGVGAADPNAGAGCATTPPPSTDIPTLSEWGLITLALLLMSYGSVMMTAVSGSTSGGSRTVSFGGHSFAMPFDNKVYRRALMLTGLLAAGGFAGCFAIYGAIFMSDLIGVAISGPVFAYLAHLLYLLETNKNKS